jgi:hypothetical protein
MHTTEVKKGEAEIKRGLVMMAIEGTRDQLDAIEQLISYPSTKCRDKLCDDVFADYYVIRRHQKIDFVAEYKSAKKIIKP